MESNWHLPHWQPAGRANLSTSARTATAGRVTVPPPGPAARRPAGPGGPPMLQVRVRASAGDFISVRTCTRAVTGDSRPGPALTLLGQVKLF